VRTAFASDPDGEQGRLVPVRVADFAPEGLLATRIYIDLVAKDRPTAQSALLDGLKGDVAAAPTDEPEFPGKRPLPYRPLLHRSRSRGYLSGPQHYQLAQTES
jgi:hypothetical protein